MADIRQLILIGLTKGLVTRLLMAFRLGERLKAKWVGVILISDQVSGYRRVISIRRH